MRKKLYVLAMLALVGPLCFAQKGSALKQLPKSIEVFRPEALDRPISVEIGNALMEGHGQKVTLETFVKGPWDVYSDRDDNTTYAQPKAKSEPYSSLKMGEKVRIARFKGDYALVYTVDEKDNTPYPRLPSPVDWKGWVPVANLLLWDKPLVSPEGTKLRVVFDSDVATASPSDESGKLYHSPAPNAKIIASLPAMTPNTFFYILKSSGSMYLLSKDKEIGKDLENLYGWVSFTSVDMWTNNLALEPTWEVSSVKDFAALGFSSTIGTGPSDNTKFGEVSFKAPEMSAYRSDYYRTPGGIWRFPLRQVMNDYYFGALVPVSSPYLLSKKNSGTSRMINEDLSNVNVFFVMDGSRDYEDFFPVVMESIPNMMTAMPDLQLKAGAVIYHDVRNEDFMAEFCPATELNDRQLLDFIDQGGDYGFQDNSGEPALFKAIQKILDDGRLRPSETNVIIVVGAKGDASGVVLDELADRLDGNNVKLFGIQVQNNSRSASYQLFNYQMENLIYTKLSDRVLKTGTERDVILRSMWKNNSLNVVNFALNTPERTFSEEHRSVESGMMDEETLRNCLQDIFGKIASEVENQKLTNAGSRDKSELFVKSYITRADGSRRSFYKYVALYDEEEFDQMMAGFQELYDLYLSSPNPIGQVCDHLLSFLEMVPDSSPIKREDRGFYETFRIYEGINLFSDEFKGVPIKNIKALKGFTPEEGRKLMDDFAVKYQKLLEIKNAAYPYVSTVNGRRCYWIPVEYLP